jgi:phosphocarrier protein HPr
VSGIEPIMNSAANMQAGERTLQERVWEATVQIKNAHGLHLRPAMRFVEVASGFDCDIRVRSDEAAADGKSIMEMSTLVAECGTRLTLRAKGPEAEQALQALRELVEVRLFDCPPPEDEETK